MALSASSLVGSVEARLKCRCREPSDESDLACLGRSVEQSFSGSPVRTLCSPHSVLTRGDTASEIAMHDAYAHVALADNRITADS